MASNEVIKVVHACCCGLDVHKRMVQACLLRTDAEGRVQEEQRTCSTLVDDLLALLDWLLDRGCTAVAMESTGPYWKPIYNLFEGHLTLLVVNAQHIKQVPGRKTDVKDAAWIAGLLRHGLLQPSVIPHRDQRELRELTRYRRTLINERSAEVNRLQKTLEGANIKLASVASNVVGTSGREILDLLVGGVTDPALLAQCARGRLKAKIPELERALAGHFGAHHRFLVARQLAHLDDLDTLIAELSGEIATRLAPFEWELTELDASTGVGRQGAEEVVAEIGVDMAPWPTADHLTSWAGMAPGNNVSAGKRQGGKTRKGSRWLRATLVVAAQAAGRSKETTLGARFRALSARRGSKRAAVAVGREILVIAYHILRDHEPYHARLPRPPRPPRQLSTDQLVHLLEAQGYEVALRPSAPAA